MENPKWPRRVRKHELCSTPSLKQVITMMTKPRSGIIEEKLKPNQTKPSELELLSSLILEMVKPP